MDNTFGYGTADSLEITFNSSKTINQIDVVTRQDDVNNPVEPTLSQTFSLYGITNFEVQYLNGATWTTVPGGSVTGNNKVWRQFTFPGITTSKIRVVVNGGVDNAFSRIVEVEAYATAPSTRSSPQKNGILRRDWTTLAQDTTRDRGASSHGRNAGLHGRGASSHNCGASSPNQGASSHNRGAGSHNCGASSHNCGASSHNCGASSPNQGASSPDQSASSDGRIVGLYGRHPG